MYDLVDHIRAISFSRQFCLFCDNNGRRGIVQLSAHPARGKGLLLQPLFGRSLALADVVAACDQRLVWQALANGQRSLEDPSGRLRNYAAGCLINVRQIMADHRDAQ